jgi:hypothetical protein
MKIIITRDVFKPIDVFNMRRNQMKSNLLKCARVLLLGVLMLTGTAAFAEERYIDFDKETPSATVEFNAKSIKLLAGATWGSGVLHYQGKDYAIKVVALTLGGVGYQEIDGKGDVYFLNKLEDFAGKYGGVAAGATAGKGKGVATLENPKKVVLKLSSESKGVALAASLGGVEIEFADLKPQETAY